MNLGFDEPGPVARALGVILGVCFGLVGGGVAEMLVTAFADTMVAALPGLRGAGAIAFYLVAALIPAAVFVALVRNPRADRSARAMGIAALTLFCLLVAGELSGLIIVDRTHVAFYLVPA